MGEGLDDPALVIVQDSPVSRQDATGRGGDQFIEGGATVLVGHNAGILVGWNRGNSRRFRRRV